MITPKIAIYTFRDFLSRALVDAIDKEIVTIQDGILDYSNSYILTNHFANYFRYAIPKEITPGFRKTFLVTTCTCFNNKLLGNNMDLVRPTFYNTEYHISSSLQAMLHSQMGILFFHDINEKFGIKNLSVVGSPNLDERTTLRFIEKYKLILGVVFISIPETFLKDENERFDSTTYMSKMDLLLKNESEVYHLIIKKQLGILNESVLK